MDLEQHIDLCGTWLFQPDPCEEGLPAGYFRTDYDRSRWQEVQIPCCFDDCGDGMRFYEGKVWFCRVLTVPEDWRILHALLRFEGSNLRTKVWVNGTQVVDNPDPFLRFESSVGEYLNFFGDNVIVVQVDNKRRYADVPLPDIGWRNFGGILREVGLIAFTRLFITDCQVTAEPSAEGGRLTANVFITNTRADETEANISIMLLDGETTVKTLPSQIVRLESGETTSLSFESAIRGIKPWTPADPNLYMVQVVLAVDGEPVHERFVRTGFRKIEVRGTQLLLNGEQIYLTGFNRHEDSPRRGMASDLETTQADLTAIKEAGSNFVRLCHYPHHPKELDLCDELGLLVMGEIPLWWWGRQSSRERIEEDRELITEAASRQLRKMIQRDRNHPSIIFWSVGNENDETIPEVVELQRRLVLLARQLDPSRLATHCSNSWMPQAHFDEDDVISVNHYPSINLFRQGRTTPECDFTSSTNSWRDSLAKLHCLYPDKPILISEFGFTSMKGVFGNAYGEDVQAEVLEQEFKAMDASYVCGAVVWCWADHAWPAGHPAISPYGVVSRGRSKLTAYERVQRMFLDRRNAKRKLFKRKMFETTMPLSD